MKHFCKIILTGALILALTAGLFSLTVLSSAAAPSSVNKTYYYGEALKDYGTHKGALDQSLGCYRSNAGFTLDGLWTYEGMVNCYIDYDTGTYHTEYKHFMPMSAYYPTRQKNWIQGSWDRVYTVDAAAAWTLTPYTYCSVLDDGTRLHPGIGCAVVLTFTVPADGTVTYNTSIYAYGSSNCPTQNYYWGDTVSVMLNDTIVGASERIGSHNSSEYNPCRIQRTGITVKAGDKLRLVVDSGGATNTAKGTLLVDLPTVTYTSASVAIRDTHTAHTWGEWGDCTATCTAAGIETRFCTFCRARESRQVSALGHDYSEWQTIQEGTCTQDGKATRSCSRCTTVVTMTTQKTGHKYSEWSRISGSCTEDGYEMSTCVYCQDRLVQEFTAPGHSWGDWKVTKTATPLAEGQETAQCTACNATQTRSIPKTGGSGTASDSDRTEPVTDSKDDDSASVSNQPTEKPTVSEGTDATPKKDGKFPWWIVIAGEGILIAAVAGAIAGILIVRKKRTAKPKSE